MPEEEKVSQEEVKEEVKDEGWDKDKQRLDQLQANVSKLASDRSELTEQLTVITEQSRGLIDKVQSLEQQLANKQEQQVAVDDSLDPDMYDDKLIKTISGLKSQIDDTKTQLQESNETVKSLLDAKNQYEADQEAKSTAQRKSDAKEKILSSLDDKYGAKYRNEALRLSQLSVDESGKAPDDALGVYLLLEGHYLALSRNTSSGETSPSVSVDTGEGGVVFNEGDIPEGSRKEVLKNVMAKFKGKSFTMPQT